MTCHLPDPGRDACIAFLVERYRRGPEHRALDHATGHRTCLGCGGGARPIGSGYDCHPDGAEVNGWCNIHQFTWRHRVKWAELDRAAQAPQETLGL